MDVKDNNKPQHIAIIMDGNGRWAKSHNLPRTQGHIEGVRRVEEIIHAAAKHGIKVLTVFTFSTENWNRPESEVMLLLNMITTVLQKKQQVLMKLNVKFGLIGRRDQIPPPLLSAIDEIINVTKSNTGMLLNMAFNYGSRIEILDAVRSLASEVREGRMGLDDITEEAFSSKLYTHGMPDPDLLIRTSGEKRISNFLLWQLSYAEFYFTEKFWPEFDTVEFEKALTDFRCRERRFGNVHTTEQLSS